MAFNLLFILANFLGNYFAGNDCGFYSLRGFAACLISLCSIGAFFIFLLLQKLISCVNRVLFKRSSNENEVASDKDKDKSKENTFDKANKVGSLRDDFYSITFLSYVYKTKEQRKEIIMNEDEVETEEEFFEDPFTKQPRELTDGEVARNFMSCIFIFIMQMTMSITVFNYDDGNLDIINK